MPINIRIKISILIIPLLFNYEGSYYFENGLKLDGTWNKLRTLIKDARRSFYPGETRGNMPGIIYNFI